MTDQTRASLEGRMSRAIEAMTRDFHTVRTGRASTSLVERLLVEYYGNATPLNQLATIHAPEPRLLTVQPYDPSIMASVERAIMESDLGLTPNLVELSGDIPPNG